MISMKDTNEFEPGSLYYKQIYPTGFDYWIMVEKTIVNGDNYILFFSVMTQELRERSVSTMQCYRTYEDGVSLYRISK